MTGKLKFRLANSALGAIITHAIVNEEGSHVVAAESGELLYWDLATREVVFKDKQEDIQQIIFFKNQTKCIVVSKKGKKKGKMFYVKKMKYGYGKHGIGISYLGELSAVLISRSFPSGEKHWSAEYSFASFKKVRYIL